MSEDGKKGLGVERGTPLGETLQHLLESYEKMMDGAYIADFEDIKEGGALADNLLSFLAVELIQGAPQKAAELDAGGVETAHEHLLEKIDRAIDDLQRLRELCEAPSRAMAQLKNSYATSEAVESAMGAGQSSRSAGVKPRLPSL